MQPPTQAEDLSEQDQAPLPPDEPSYQPGPSIKPALVILLIVAVVVFGGLALALIGGNGPASPPVTPGSRLAGSPLAATPAASLLAPIVSDGEPPTAVINALAVPSGSSKAEPPKNASAGVDQFDSKVYLAVPASPADVIAFYKVELHHAGWGPMSGGDYKVNGGNGTLLLYERAAPDGYYWEVAVIVTPSIPKISPALGGGDQTAPTSLLELDLLQIEDAS